MISGIVCPETKPDKKITQRKGGRKQKRSETGMNTDFISFDTLKKKICNKIVEL